MLRVAFESAPVGMAVCALDGGMLIVNESLCSMLGYSRSELIARHWTEYVELSGAPPAREGDPRRAYLHLKGGMWVRATVWLREVTAGPADHLVLTLCRSDDAAPSAAPAGEPAERDPLTGLPTRHALERFLQKTLAATQGQSVGVLSLGLDRFGDINASMGRSVGDNVLRHVAELLRQYVGKRGNVGRTDGDRFVVVLPGVDSARAEAQATAIGACLSHSHEIDGHLVRAPVSIGVAFFPKDGDNAGALLASADVALHEAKVRDRRACRFFTMHMRQAAFKRVTLEARLRRAIERNELELYYQPKLSIQTGRLTGAEALVRWRCPDRGLVPPAEFIPIAEESGLIVPLGDWVLEEALRQAAEWRREHAVSVVVAVNVSPTQLDGRRPIQWIMGALKRHAIPPEMLEIEITESVVMRDADGTVFGLSELAQQGVRLALDDFGTGYSNLAQLRRMPITTVKIDRSLITHIAAQPKDAAIVRAIIEIAHALGTRVVAEGVETIAQLGTLRMSRCDFLQGYLIAPPLSAADFLDWIRQTLREAQRLLCTRAAGPRRIRERMLPVE